MKTKIIIAAVLAVLCTTAVSCGTVENLNEQSTTKIQTTTDEKTTEAETTSEEVSTIAAESKAAEKTTVEKTTDVSVEVPTEAGNEESSEEDSQAEQTEAPEIEAPENESSVDENPVAVPPTEAPTEAPVAVGSFDSSDLSFNGGALLGDASGLIGAMGAASSVDEAAGCLSNGADQKIYHFGGVDVSCYVQDGAEYIYDITITGGYTTSKGIGIGSSKADVIAAYGEGADSGQYILYGSGDYGLYIYFSGDTVSMIDYYAAV